MLCFSALCEPTKRKKQLEVEHLKQKRGLGIVNLIDGEATITFGRANPIVVSESDSDSDEDEV